MPYKTDKLKLPRNLDLRIKINKEQRKNIIKIRKSGISYNIIARMFGVSKRLIYFICNPEKLKKAKEQYKIRRADGRYYIKDKHTKAMRKHRRRKHKLLKDKI